MDNGPAEIRQADLDSEEFAALIDTHKQLMLEHSPPESSHALLVDGLRDPGITVWEMRRRGVLVGCGALKVLSASHGEIKSMHTLAALRGLGLGRQMLKHIIKEAGLRGYDRLSLETGSMDGFHPARRLYEAYGFTYCSPFSGYAEDPNSVFMTLELGANHDRLSRETEAE